MPLVKSKIFMILPWCHLRSIPGKFLWMLVQNGCLDSQKVHVFAHVKESIFAKKNQKMMQFLGPKNGVPFLNLQPLAPVKFSLRMVRGTKNGAQKWNPKMVPQKMKKCWQTHREITVGGRKFNSRNLAVLEVAISF